MIPAPIQAFPQDRGGPLDRNPHLFKDNRTVKKISGLHLILAMSFVLFAAGLWWGLPDVRGWAPDEITPGSVVDGLRMLFSNGWYDRYPPFHFYLLSLLYAPFLVLHKLHILDLRQLSSYTLLFYLGRLLTVIMGTGTIYLVYRCGREIFDRRAALASALIAALIVPFEYYSKTVNLDVPYIFWFVVSLYFFLRILKTRRTIYYLLFAGAAVLSVCTKDQAYGLFVLAPLPVVLFDWKSKRKSEPGLSLLRSLFDKNYLYAILAGTALFLVIHNLAFNLQGFLGHVKLITGGASESYRIYPRSLSGEVRLLGLTLRQIQGSFGWPLLLVCGGGLVWSLVRKKKNGVLLSLLVFAASYYVFYIGAILFNCDRYNLPICVVLSFFGGGLIADQWRPGVKLFKAKSVLLAIVFIYSFFYSLSVDILMISDSRYAVERWMRQNLPKQATVGIAAPMEYSPRLTDFQGTYLSLSWEAFQRGPRPDVVVFPSAYSRNFVKGTPEFEFYNNFPRAGETYELALRYQTSLAWLVIRYRNAWTNIDAINPEIELYERAGLRKQRRP
jgi:hypothetical protein